MLQSVRRCRPFIINASAALSNHSNGGLPLGLFLGTCTVLAVNGSPLWRWRSNRKLDSKLWMMPTTNHGTPVLVSTSAYFLTAEGSDMRAWILATCERRSGRIASLANRDSYSSRSARVNRGAI